MKNIQLHAFLIRRFQKSILNARYCHVYKQEHCLLYGINSKECLHPCFDASMVYAAADKNAYYINEILRGCINI